jgi:hypothetical protein
MIAHEAPKTSGFGAEIASTIQVGKSENAAFLLFNKSLILLFILRSVVSYR